MSDAVFDKSLSDPPPIPPQAVKRVNQLLESGRLFRYGEEDGEGNDVALLEAEFATLIGRRYCIAMNSCGSAMFVALKVAGVQSGTPVLFNAFTLAPVPGAILHAGGIPVPVEIGADLLIDAGHLASQARSTGARHLLLSHMRGHVAHLDRVTAVCKELGLTLIEDCAHTMGASWNGRLTGTFGAAGCFSTQSFKHVNSGEGGLLVMDDDEWAAKAILYSGSYALYSQHRSRPPMETFENLRGRIPNCSLRMSNLTAALIQPQLGELPQRLEVWRARYRQLEQLLSQIPGISLPKRDPKEEFVPSSMQFLINEATPQEMLRFIEGCRARGVHLKWFGTPRSDGFTERLEHWRFIPADHTLHHTPMILATLCDLRIPLSLTDNDCQTIAAVLRHVLDTLPARPPNTAFRPPPLWSADEVAEATGGQWHVRPAAGWAPTNVSYDIASRGPGSLLICVHPSSWGKERSDAARELNRCIANGAVGAVIQREQLSVAQTCMPGFPLLLVSNTRLALRDLCRASRERFTGKVIAVTGTVGKTTSREMLRHVLDGHRGAVATRGNNNNIAGVQRTMAYTPRGADFSILEMGFGQPLNGIAISSKQVRPHVALITAIGLAHLDVFGEQTREYSDLVRLVAEQKLGILAGMAPGGTLVVHHNPAVLNQIKAAAKRQSIRTVTFGDHRESDVRLIHASVESGQVRASIEGRLVEYKLKIPGRHMAINSLGVIASARAVNADLELVVYRLSDFTAVDGRVQVAEVPVEGGTALLIDDSFNATPDSVRATLNLLAEYAPERTGRRIAVLGDILHLGPASAALHTALAGAIRVPPIDRVFTFGSQMLYLHRALPDVIRGLHASSLSELEEAVRAYLKPGDILTVKASTPIGLGRLASSMRYGTFRVDVSTTSCEPK